MQGSVVWLGPTAGHLPPRHFYKSMFRGHLLWKMALGRP